jgi:hypothetical protein
VTTLQGKAVRPQKETRGDVEQLSFWIIPADGHQIKVTSVITSATPKLRDGTPVEVSGNINSEDELVAEKITRLDHPTPKPPSKLLLIAGAVVIVLLVAAVGIYLATRNPASSPPGTPSSGGAQPTGPCKPGYTSRLALPTDQVCVTSATRAEVIDDNSKAQSRLATATYGPDTCAQGYVWRDARQGDHVCVTPDVRAQAAGDNAAAAARRTIGPYGPDTCIQGFVWREAWPTPPDHVCVLPQTRSQAASDNAQAHARLATATYGPDTCAQGFVWREATPTDHVCVTPAVRSQTAQDNRLASSRAQ